MAGYSNSPILTSLGFGLGDQLSSQVGDESEEEQRRRRLGLLQRQQLGSNAELSPVARSLFGAYGR